MDEFDLKQWRLQKGWTLRTAAKQLRLPISKLREMEEAGKLSAHDKRLCKVLIVGIVAIGLYEGVTDRHKKIMQEKDMQE